MRYVVLIVGFIVVSIIFRDHGPGFYIGAAFVYMLYKSMGEQRRPLKTFSPKSQVSAKIGESLQTPSSTVATQTEPQSSSESPNGPERKDTPSMTGGPEPHESLPPTQATQDELRIEATPNQIADQNEEAPAISTPEEIEGLEASGPLVKVRSFGNSAEALLAAGLLGSMGIECLVTSQSQLTVGETALVVKPKDLEAAREALDARNRGQEKFDDSEDTAKHDGPIVVVKKQNPDPIAVSPRSGTGRNWAGVVVVVVVAIFVLVKGASILLDNQESDDQGLQYAASHHDYAPSVPLFGTEGCVAERLNQVKNAAHFAPTSTHRHASIKWFCSRDWDQARLSKDAVELQASSLSLCQVLSAVDAQNPRTEDCHLVGLPDDLASFIVVFDSAPVIELMEERIHPLPKYRTGAEAQMFGRVIERPRSDLQKRILGYTSNKQLPVDYYEDLTLPQQTAREYRLRESPFDVRIITNAGLRACFRDVFDGAYSSPSISSGKWHDESPDLEAIEPEADIDTNFSVGMIWMSVKLLITESVGLIQSRPETDFRDINTAGSLTMVLLNGDSRPSGSSTSISEREGWYDPDTSTLGVTSIAGLGFGKTTTPATLKAKVQQLVPAALSHEIYHHVFYRPSIASSGFELEGEATVLGEREHQMQVLGTEASINDPIMVLWRKINKELKEQPDPEQMAGIWDEYVKMNELITQRYNRKAKFTPVQCGALDLVASTGSKGQMRIDLADTLTLTPGDFQSRQNVSTLYAVAWAVYHHLYAEDKSELIRSIEEVHEKQEAHIGISEEDRQELNKILTDTVVWAKTEKKRRTECR